MVDKTGGQAVPFFIMAKKKYQRNPNYTRLVVEVTTEEKEALEIIKQKKGVPLSQIVRPYIKDCIVENTLPNKSDY